MRYQQNYSGGDIVREMIGQDRQRLREVSPVNLAEAIRVPVLLAHGTDDRSVTVRHGRRMRDALADANAEFVYIEQQGGDHFLSREEHRLAFFREMEAFLATHLAASP